MYKDFEPLGWSSRSELVGQKERAVQGLMDVTKLPIKAWAEPPKMHKSS